MTLSTNSTELVIRTPLTIALGHFSYNSNKFVSKIVKEIFRKHLFMPLIGMKTIKPYNYFNQYSDDNGIAYTSFVKSVFVNHVTYTVSSYVFDYTINNNLSETFSLNTTQNNFEISSLVWMLEKVALPFGLSRINPNYKQDLIRSNPELASNLLSIYCEFKTAKAAFEHISYEYNNWNKFYYKYQEENTINSCKDYFYSTVDFLGSFVTGGLALAFTCAVQYSAYQHDNQYIKNAAFIILSYKVATTSMFVASTAVEFLIKLPINTIYSYLYLNSENLETNINQQQYSEPTNIEQTQIIIELGCINRPKAEFANMSLIVYQGNEIYSQPYQSGSLIYTIPTHMLTLYQKQKDLDILLPEHFTQSTFFQIMSEKKFDNYSITCPTDPDLAITEITGNNFYYFDQSL